MAKEENLLSGGAKSLSDFANAHEYFGLHRDDKGNWIFREWAPNATAITLTGDFSNWKKLKNTPSKANRAASGK